MSQGAPRWFGLPLLLCSLLLVGCPESSTPPRETPGGPEPDRGHDGHDHDDHVHEDDFLPLPEVEDPGDGTGARLTLGKAAVDFGEIDQGEIPSHVFPFENTGDRDLIIYRVRPSCRCVTAETTRERIPPGQGGEIHVRYDSTGRGGADHKKVYVICNDPRRQRVKIVIEVNVKVRPHPTISLLPRSLDLGILRAGEVARARLEAKNVGDEDLLIINVESPGEGKAKSPPAPRVPPGGRTGIEIEVRPGTRRGAEHFTFFVQSNDPFHKRMAFTASAYIPVSSGPTLRIEPGALRLGEIGAGPASWGLTLFNRGGQPLEVLEVRREDGDDRFRLEIPTGLEIAPGREGRGKIVFSGGGETGAVRSRWLVGSNDGVLPERSFDIFATVSEAPPSGRGPSLLLGHEEWDMGIVSRLDGISHPVTIFNRGDAPLEISGLSCFEPSHPFTFDLPERIPPGGEGTLQLHLSPGSPPGVLDYVFNVESNDPGGIGTQISVTGYVEKSDRTFPEGSRLLTILYSGDEAGEIQACGCGAAQQGGVSRAAAAAADIRARVPTLVVNAGDVFGTPEDHFRLRADLALGALSLMGADAMAIGESDLAFGLDYLREGLSTAGIQAVGCNLAVREGGEPFGKGVVRREAGGVSVAIIGVTHPGYFDSERDPLVVRDPAEALRAVLSRTREDVDVVVLLAHMGMERTLALIREVPGVDVAVVGHGEKGLDAPIREGRTLVVANGGGGKTLGRLDLGVDPDGTVHGVGSLISLTPEIGEDKDVAVLLDRYRRKLMALPAPSAPPLEAGPFIGSRKCKDCHAEAYALWAGSGHGKAFTTLRQGNSHYDPECVGCHTVGYEKTGGFVREDVNQAGDGTNPLIHVGCEACHGPGREHVRAMEAGEEKPYGSEKIRSICQRCHTEDRNPNFRFEEFWKKIEH